MQQKEKKDEEKNLIIKIKRKPIITQLKKSKMTLKELQQMIKEEFDAYMGEAEDDVDVSVSDNDIDAEMGDMGDDIDETEEDVLRRIFDILKTHFEGGEGDMEGDLEDLGDEEPSDESSEEDLEEKKEEELDEAPKDDEDTMEEAAAQGFGDAGNKKTSGKDSGYTPAKTTRGDGKLHEKKSPLQERFQKLANIIK